jgi:hypothetical protein
MLNMIWYIVFIVILFILFILILFRGKERAPRPKKIIEKRTAPLESKKPISYVSIVSEVLRHYRELKNPEDIIKRLGAECVVDNIDKTRMQLLDESLPLPEGSEQKVFRFRESKTRNVVIEVVFHKGQLINFRGQIYLYDLNTRNISEFVKNDLYPLISDIIGTKKFRYESFTDTYYYDDFNGLIVGFRASPENLSVSTHIIDKIYA